MNIAEWIRLAESRCTKFSMVCTKPGEWFVECHHVSGIVCRGQQETLEFAIEAAVAHGKTRAKSMGVKKWEF